MFLDIFNIRYQIERFSAHSLTLMLAFPKERIEIECRDKGVLEIAVFEGEEISDLRIDELLHQLSED